MKKILFLFLLYIECAEATAQRPTNAAVRQSIDSINRLLDKSVVNKKLTVLQKHYAEDFVFTHGTGLIDSKRSWLKDVMDTATHFISREHDSTVVELHQDVAIATGLLKILRHRKGEKVSYGLRYVRVFARREKTWQLISHRTTAEWHY